ncbi:E3 ubiquitin-protein ligase RNF34 [Pelomyxa schiedti]|nr:E3 ubiquitin-protein ligase RNF34 [Pelomyxa schiedti]
MASKPGQPVQVGGSVKTENEALEAERLKYKKSVKVTIKNDTNYSFLRTKIKIMHSVWTKEPPPRIGANQIATFATHCGAVVFFGTADVWYAVQNRSCCLHFAWNIESNPRFDAPPFFIVTEQHDKSDHSNIVFTVTEAPAPPSLPAQSTTPHSQCAVTVTSVEANPATQQYPISQIPSKSPSPIMQGLQPQIGASAPTSSAPTVSLPTTSLPTTQTLSPMSPTMPTYYPSMQTSLPTQFPSPGYSQLSYPSLPTGYQTPYPMMQYQYPSMQGMQMLPSSPYMCVYPQQFILPTQSTTTAANYPTTMTQTPTAQPQQQQYSPTPQQQQYSPTVPQQQQYSATTANPTMLPNTTTTTPPSVINTGTPLTSQTQPNATTLGQVGSSLGGFIKGNFPEDELCKVCMEKTINCVILRCGHFCVCIDCGRQLKECCMCRQPVVELIRTFKS